MPITAGETHTALDAFARCGKGRGHPARLYMGDCYACAMARDLRVRLLFKDDGFPKTDIESAV